MDSRLGQSTTITSSTQVALCKPIYQRCFEISKIIDEAATKDLHLVFPAIVENIFAFNNQPGWGLNRLTQSTHHTDFAALRVFLGPDGPLLRMVYRLQTEPSFVYEFPLSCLPHPSRVTIEDGIMPNLYLNKLQANAYTNTVTAVTLSAFEFYFFHFAYMLVNPQFRTQSNWVTPQEALYPNVLEDYLQYFLPTSAQRITPMPNYASPVRSPVIYKSPQANYRQSPTMYGSPSSLQQHNSPYRGLLKMQSPCLQRGVSLPNAGTEAIEQETWRSEMLIQIFTEFWLNQNIMGSETGIRSQFMHPGPLTFWARFVPYKRQNGVYYDIAAEQHLPSPDHVRVVRMFIKHVHLFCNSATPELVTPSYHSPGMHIQPLDDFKRSVIPRLIQKKLYTFLRHNFEKWPLDSSFRLTLETWLSYIQPWRYTVAKIPRCTKGTDSPESQIDEKWYQFISENVLFYTNIFQEFMQRLFRIDLSSSKNAYMLFRVSKIFGQSDLKDILNGIESSVYEVPTHPSSPGSSYLSHPSSSLIAQLSLQMAELEGPTFHYKPLLCDQNKRMIEDILHLCMLAKDTASTRQATFNGPTSNTLMSWLGFGPLVDYNSSSFGQGLDADNQVDEKKLQLHLSQSVMFLCKIFDVKSPSVEHSHNLSRSDMSAVDGSSVLPDHLDTPDGPVLTPLGRHQLMNGLRKFDVKYQGDPELYPVQSHENPSLVRLLYWISSHVNEKHGQQLHQLYCREDWVGRFVSHFLSPPRSILMQSNATSPSAPSALHKVAKKIMTRPRVSLRFLASYGNMGYLVGLYFISYVWFGTNPVKFIFFLIFVLIMYGLVSALLFRSKRVHVE